MAVRLALETCNKILNWPLESLGKEQCVERIPSWLTAITYLPLTLIWLIPLKIFQLYVMYSYGPCTNLHATLLVRCLNGILRRRILVHYQLIRADGSSKRYSSMIRMLQGIDREDLEALWRIVKAKYGDTRPENEFERVLYGDLKVMFEPDIKSDVWRMLQGYRVTIWKLIDSSGVHFVRRNLKIQKMNIKFRGGLLGLKRLHGFLEVTAAQCCWWKDYDCLKTFYCQEDKDELKR
ncbi:hypothetical protein Tco_0972661 [Tanacetum coccineum]